MKCPACQSEWLIDAKEKYWKWRKAFNHTVHCMKCGRNWIVTVNKTLEPYAKLFKS